MPDITLTPEELTEKITQMEFVLATKEDVKQLAALQMEFKKEIDMLKEGHMDLAARVAHNELAVVLQSKFRDLQDENRYLKYKIKSLEGRA